MASPLPPHLQSAYDHVMTAFQAVEGKEIDAVKLPWAEVEKSVIKLLGGSFNLQRPEHQAIALGLAAIFGKRFQESDGAFWFPNRETPEAAMLGFPDALLMLSPFGAVLDALAKAKLSQLDDVSGEIRRALAQSKFAVTAKGPQRLTDEDYRRLFDPGFVQFLAIDPKRLTTLFDTRPDVLSRDLKDAISRSGNQFPAESRAQFEQQIVGTLQRLDASKPLSASVGAVPRLGELLIHLFAVTHVTGAAPEEFWHEAVLPLLFIGSPENFPPLDDEEIDAVKQGTDPLALFLDLVPYQQQAPEDGMLGVFEMEDLSLPRPELEQPGASPRLLQLKSERIAELAKKFEPAKSKDTLERFSKYLSERAGVPVKASAPGEQMTDAAQMLLGELKAVMEHIGEGKASLGLRRITEAEAMSEGSLAMIRKALQGPRLIIPGL